MAIAHALPHSSARATQPAACCLARTDDARRLATAAAAVVTPGRLLYIGCGAGPGNTELPLALVPTRTSEPVAVRHTIARLLRPVVTQGVPQ